MDLVTFWGLFERWRSGDPGMAGYELIGEEFYGVLVTRSEMGLGEDEKAEMCQFLAERGLVQEFPVNPGVKREHPCDHR